MVTVVCVRVVTIMCEREVTVIECAIGGLPKFPKFTCSGHTFQGCGGVVISVSRVHVLQIHTLLLLGRPPSPLYGKNFQIIP